MMHILVLADDNTEKNYITKRIRSALGTLCGVTNGLTNDIFVKDINIQVTSTNPKTGNAIGTIYMQPDYYVCPYGVKTSDLLHDICLGATKLDGVSGIIRVVKDRNHYAKRESFNNV